MLFVVEVQRQIRQRHVVDLSAELSCIRALQDVNLIMAAIVASFKVISRKN